MGALLTSGNIGNLGKTAACLTETDDGARVIIAKPELYLFLCSLTLEVKSEHETD